MAEFKTRFDIGDMVYDSEEAPFRAPGKITGVLITKEREVFYYFGGCTAYREERLRTKEEQIVAINARVVEFIQGK